MYTKTIFPDPEVCEEAEDAVVLSQPPSQAPITHHIPGALTTSLYANSVLLQTPATCQLRDCSLPSHGALKKCQGLNSLESSLWTTKDKNRRVNIPVSVSSGGTNLKRVPHHLPEGPGRPEPQVRISVNCSLMLPRCMVCLGASPGGSS